MHETRKKKVPAKERLIAIIDIGTTFIRMIIAERNLSGEVTILEKATQSVAMGRDIVDARRISTQTVEQCVGALESYLRLLVEYGLSADEVRAVAPSVVSEAENWEICLDRISTATGISFQLLDPGQVGYYYHLAIKSMRTGGGKLDKSENIVCEVGGMNSLVLCRAAGEIRFVQTYSVGSLQLRRQMETAALGLHQLSALAEGRTHEIAMQIRQNVDDLPNARLLFMGREIRLAVAHLRKGRTLTETGGAADLTVAELQSLLSRIEKMSIEELVRTWCLTYSDAELLVPALCIAISIAETLGVSQVQISSLSFCDGLLEEAVGDSSGTKTMRKHIIRVAKETGEKYQYDEKHAAKVSENALMLFDLLQNEHGCTPRHRLLLEVAALLHDIGVFVSVQGHHKHSMYLIRNTEFAGLSGEEIELAAVLARYHRKALPEKSHDEYMKLTAENRLVIGKLAALLRVADALDRVHDQSLGVVRFEIDEASLRCIPGRRVTTSAEQVALAEKGDLFELMYGRRCCLQNPE